MTTIAPQAYRMILAAADNLIHLARLHGVLPTLETEPRQPLAMGNHFLRLALRPVRNPEPAAADNCRRPDLLEKLAYHEGARCDMSLEDCLSFLANGWKETPGRSYTQLVLQLTELLAAVPFRPYCNDDCRARTNGIEAELQALRKKVATYEARDALGLLPASTTPYAPLTTAEARDLTCMLAGAPWPDEMLPELQQLLGIYDGLRAHGQRPVDPATLPRKVAKAVMKTGLLPSTDEPSQATHQEGATEAVKPLGYGGSTGINDYLMSDGTVKAMRPGEVNWVGTSSHHLLPKPAAADAAHPDEAAADRFVAAMKDKLAKARAKGRSGWDSPEHCSPQKLATMLVHHVAKGDPVDVANFAMMLHQRVALGIDPATNNRTAPLKMALGAYVESDGYWNGWGAQLKHLCDQVALALDEMSCCNYNSAAERLRHAHQETEAKAPAPKGLMSTAGNAKGGA